MTSTTTNASCQLSGSCQAVVRAECTAARLLARWQQQLVLGQQEQQEAAADASRAETSNASLRDDRATRAYELVAASCIFRASGPFGAKIFFACGALRRA